MKKRRIINANQPIVVWSATAEAFGHNYGRRGKNGGWRCIIDEGDNVTPNEPYAITGPEYQFPTAGLYSVFWDIMLEEIVDANNCVASLAIYDCVQENQVALIALHENSFSQNGATQRFFINLEVTLTTTVYDFRVTAHANADFTTHQLGVIPIN